MKLRVGGWYMSKGGHAFYCYGRCSDGFLMGHEYLATGGYWYEDGAFERFDHPRNLVKEILP